MKSICYHFSSREKSPLTVRYSSTFSPLGALIFTPPTYRESIKLLLKTGVTSVPFVSGEKWQYNASSGSVWAKPPLPPQVTQLFMQEVRKYIGWWNKNFVLYNIAPGYPVSIIESYLYLNSD
jgi:hypothetical protein